MTETTTDAMAMSISVEGLKKRYQRTKGSTGEFAVDDVSFDVPDGQFLTLLGPSGCGKTTTLRCIAGLEEPTGGRISMAGEVVYDESRRRSVIPEQRPIGMVPQSYGIWPHMTVLDNAAFSLRHGRRKKGQTNIRERTMTMLEQVGLSAYADRWATQLSGGQQQRLALARALMSEPEVLLLDEPLSNLDAKLRVKLRGELREFQEQFGVTAVYVTHDQAEALAMSDIVILMNQGKIEQIDSPEKIYSRPNTVFVADFIGSANLVPATGSSAGNGDILTDTAIGPLRCASPDQSVAAASGSVCVRPEDVKIIDSSSEGSNVFSATVASGEYLGDRLELVLDIAGTAVRASVAAESPARPGSSVKVGISPDKARWLTS